MRSNDKFVVSGYQLFDFIHIFINVFKLTDVNPNQPCTLGVNSSNYFNDVKGENCCTSEIINKNRIQIKVGPI